MEYTELCADCSIWSISIELIAVLMINVIIIVFMVSADHIVVRIVVGWVVVVDLFQPKKVTFSTRALI